MGQLKDEWSLSLPQHQAWLHTSFYHTKPTGGGKEHQQTTGHISTEQRKVSDFQIQYRVFYSRSKSGMGKGPQHKSKSKWQRNELRDDTRSKMCNKKLSPQLEYQTELSLSDTERKCSSVHGIWQPKHEMLLSFAISRLVKVKQHSWKATLQRQVHLYH